MTSKNTMANTFHLWAIAVCAVVLSGHGGGAADVGTIQQIQVERVWAGHPVGFCLLTHAPFQFVAYYDAERRMSVAQRRLDSTNWTITRLPSKLGWDSHNYVTMAVDREGILHLAGNMHCVPLVYFRSEKPMDAASLKRGEGDDRPARGARYLSGVSARPSRTIGFPLPRRAQRQWRRSLQLL